MTNIEKFKYITEGLNVIKTEKRSGTKSNIYRNDKNVVFIGSKINVSHVGEVVFLDGNILFYPTNLFENYDTLYVEFVDEDLNKVDLEMAKEKMQILNSKHKLIIRNKLTY